MTTVTASALTAVTPGAALRAVSSAALISAPHAQSVLDVVHARHRLRDVFCASLVFAAVDVAAQSYFTVVDRHHDLKRVEVIILAQPVVDVFAYPLVGSAIVFWSTSATPFVHTPALLGFFIAKPRSDRV